MFILEGIGNISVCPYGPLHSPAVDRLPKLTYGSVESAQATRPMVAAMKTVVVEKKDIVTTRKVGYSRLDP